MQHSTQPMELTDSFHSTPHFHLPALFTPPPHRLTSYRRPRRCSFTRGAAGRKESEESCRLQPHSCLPCCLASSSSSSLLFFIPHAHLLPGLHSRRRIVHRLTC